MFADLAKTSRKVVGTRSRGKKTQAIADCLAGLVPDDVFIAAHYLSGTLPQGRIGIGRSVLTPASKTIPALEPTLDITEVHHVFDAIAAIGGAGAVKARTESLRRLFARATAEEQDFLYRLLSGDLRQGALEGVMVEAIAKAFRLNLHLVRRGNMLIGDIAEVARIARRDGELGLKAVRLSVGQPLRSMLAQPADSVRDAFSDVEDALFDVKLDGARVQIHKSGSEVGVFTRNLREIGAGVPELVESVRALPVDDIVLDGETIALDEDGRPYPFQSTMRRFGRQDDVAKMRQELPLSVRYFDCLHRDGTDLIGLPLVERLVHLDAVVPETERVPRLIASDADEAERFFEQALAEGHEGVMVKDPSSAYEAGGRGKSWRKVKQSHTLDLVVLAAEWGTGRRKGFLSNLHLGAWDDVGKRFVMLGRTFKGLTDEMLEWQTRELLKFEVSREGNTVFVEPRLVVEIAFNDVQESPHYPGGVALRFARVKRYRADKTVKDIDTLEKVLIFKPRTWHGADDH